MKSTKVLTINPIPSGVNQKLVPAKKYNELWEDVYALEQANEAPPFPVKDYGIPDPIYLWAISGLTAAVITTRSVSISHLIRAVHYKGTGQLEYVMAKVGDPSPAWVTDPDKMIWSDNGGPGVVTFNINVRDPLDPLGFQGAAQVTVTFL